MRGSLTAARLLTLLLFLLLVAICAYWALQILAPRPAIAPSASIGDAAAAPNLEPATVLFGSANATASAPSGNGNIQVSGVAEAGPEGVVILSIDGKPGEAFGVNSTVTEGTVVKSVQLDKVVLEQRGKLIELKTPTRASLDVLSSGVGKSRTPSDSTAAPVPTRTVAPPPAQPQFQPPQPQQQQLQQQQMQQQLQQQQLQQQQLQQQQLQQQQLQQQQEQLQQQAAQPQGQPLPPGGSAGGMSQGTGSDGSQPGTGTGSTAVSGQRQVPGQQPMSGQQGPTGQAVAPGQQPLQTQ